MTSGGEREQGRSAATSHPEALWQVARLAAQLLAEREQLPGELPVRPLGEGTDHWTFDVGGRYVVRFPKEDAAAERLAAEAQWVRWLAPKLPLRIPAPSLHHLPGSAFLRPFLSYPRLAGAPALEAAPGQGPSHAVAQELGHFLRALHTVEASEAAARGLPSEPPGALDAWREDALADLALCRERGHLEGARAAQWARLLEAPPDAAAVPMRVIHGDLAAEHVLVDGEGRVGGVIDWSDAALGDPARDLAGLAHWGGPMALASCVRAYGPVGRGTLVRAHWFAACRAVADIAFGETHGRPAYVQGGLRALAHVEALGPVAHGPDANG